MSQGMQSRSSVRVGVVPRTCYQKVRYQVAGRDPDWAFRRWLFFVVMFCPSVAAYASEGPPVRSLVDQFLFVPAKYPVGEWTPSELDFRDVDFVAADKTRLHGWYCPCDQPRAVILLAHGNAGNIATRVAWLRYLQRTLRVSVFAFDYRGYGKSGGKPTIDGALQDARAARAKLCELAAVKDSDIVLMGESLGGAIVVQLAATAAPRALILQSTFSSLRDIAQVHFRLLSGIVSKTKLNSSEAIAKYHGPLMQSHGNQDRTIPYSLGEKLFNAANQPKEWIEIASADHNDWLTQSYVNQLDRFIERLNNNSK